MCNSNDKEALLGKDNHHHICYTAETGAEVQIVFTVTSMLASVSRHLRHRIVWLIVG